MKTRDSQPETLDPEPSIQKPGPRSQDQGFETQDLSSRKKIPGSKSQNQVPRHRTGDMRPRFMFYITHTV